MSAAHTPGPWEQSTVKAANGDVCHGVKSSAAFITVAWLNGRTENEAIKNARLIAAAPELLEALKLARQIIGRPDDYCTKIIDSAIAKATGYQSKVIA